MIVASFRHSDTLLSISGHSNRSEVCGAVSCLTGTLFAGYRAAQPSSGKFEHTFGRDDDEISRFVVMALETVAVNYPADLKLVRL